MKTKIILILLLVSFIKLQAQERDSLWSSFRTNLDIIIKVERGKSYTLDFYDGPSLNNEVANIILNSSIEEQSLTYMYQYFRRDSLPNIRDYIGEIFHKIARSSNNVLTRKKAIDYLFDIYIEPGLSNLILTDIDDNLKQKLLKLFNRQFTEEELSFFAASNVKYRMINDKKNYDYMIADTIKKYNNTISYKEAKEKVFQSEVMSYRETIIEMLPSGYILIIAAQLNLRETIPFLEEYAGNEKYDDSYRKYAICALAYMGIEDYEQKAVKYFEGDDFQNDIELAKFMNNQNIWYAYIHRFKSKKYLGTCPVAYRTIRDIARSLNRFPILFEDCKGESIGKKVEIHEATIKKMVDWMEANKGKYELIKPVERTF
jgi:hypothetical protein